MADDAQDGYQGQKELATGNNPFNALSFLVKMMLGKINVATLVQVVAVYPAGTANPQDVGTVDVLPLVGQVDGAGTIWPGTTLFGLPYFRLQAGTTAFVIDPVVGDIGLAVFCDKDISSVKSTLDASGPGSARRFDMADGFYFGGWMNQTDPTTFVLAIAGELNLVTPTNSLVMNGSSVTTTMGGTTIVQNGSNVTITGTTKVVGTLEVTGATTLDSTLAVSSTVTAGGEISHGSHTLSAHTHGGVQGGSSNTGGPVG